MLYLVQQNAIWEYEHSYVISMSNAKFKMKKW